MAVAAAGRPTGRTDVARLTGRFDRVGLCLFHDDREPSRSVRCQTLRCGGEIRSRRFRSPAATNFDYFKPMQLA
jgi:hypothetical protein